MVRIKIYAGDRGHRDDKEVEVGGEDMERISLRAVSGGWVVPFSTLGIRNTVLNIVPLQFSSQFQVEIDIRWTVGFYIVYIYTIY